jgi:ParB family chromosome partitioning protein
MGELVDSIKTHGLIQPVLVRPLSAEGEEDSGEYQLVAGERRWRAAQLAGLDVIPAVIRRLGDQQALELALIENVQRHDITAIDAAIAYQRLAGEFHLSQEQIAQRVGKSRSAVANTLRLLDLPQEVRKAIEDGALTEGHGRAILLAPGEGARRAIFRRVLRDRLSVREAERLAQHSAAAEANGAGEGQSGVASSDTAPDTTPEDATAGAAPSAGSDLGGVEELLQKRLGTRLHIKAKRKGGEIVISYSSPEELNRIVSLVTQTDSQQQG